MRSSGVKTAINVSKTATSLAAISRCFDSKCTILCNNKVGVIAMRKFIFLMLMIVVSSNAKAEWVGVGYSPSSGFTTYTDPTTIRENGNMVKMWNMYVHKIYAKIKGKPFVSMKFQGEYDCDEGQTRTLYRLFYAGNMGQGEMVDSEATPDNWMPTPPGSTNELLWKIACGKIHLK